ncbi:KilA-N domain-containing protein, partial [Xanthomonas perforans]
MSQLIIASTTIRRDDSGRYCLNDLHRAAGGEKRHQPSDWLRLQQTVELATEISAQSIPGIPGIHARQGFGTFVAKE